MKKTISLVLVLVLGLAEEVVNADFTFGEPQDLGLGSGGYISVSADELELYFTSDRAGRLGYEDLWVSTRQSVDDPWGSPTNLQTVNSTYRDAFPSISPDGLTLYFSDFFYGPDRPGGLGEHDLWFSTRASRNDPWGAPVNMGAPFSRSGWEVSPTLSHDELIFIFASGRFGSSPFDYDLWMCTRPSVQEAWGLPVNMGPRVNSSSHDYNGNLSPDGLVLFFESDRSGNFGVWMTMRRTVNDPWEPPLPLPEPMYSTPEPMYSMGVGCVSADGSMFYAGMSQVPIVPVVDFDGDRKVDIADLQIMVDHWGEDYPLCDIGPMPWGNGIVDVQDLIVLAEHLFDDYRALAQWKLDEKAGDIAYDSVGNNHGNLIGNPIWQPAGGKAVGALQLDGIDDYLSTPFVLNPSNSSLCAFAWIKGGAPGQAIISQTGDFGGTWLGINSSEGKLMTGFSDMYFGALVSETIITDGQWHHVGLVYDFDSLHRRLYVDGALVAEDAMVVSGMPSDGGLYIGASKDLDAASFFSGLIDDVRIYEVSLTAEEIEALSR